MVIQTPQSFGKLNWGSRQVSWGLRKVILGHKEPFLTSGGFKGYRVVTSGLRVVTYGLRYRLLEAQMSGPREVTWDL